MTIWIKVLVCFLASAGAGIGTGFAGLSAAAVIGPVLICFLKIPAYQAVGIGLASDVLASAISAGTYYKHGNLDIKGSLPLIASVLIMTIVGSLIAGLVPDRAIGSGSQITMLIIGIKFIVKPVRNTKTKKIEEDSRKRIIKAIFGGVIVGLICGFIGAGGGMMLLFVLTTFLGYDMHMAVGTSVFIMAFTALTGGISHFVIGGLPDLTCLLLCVGFTLLWARIAAVLANKAKAVTLNRIVGVVMMLTGLVVLGVNYWV